ncbi:MAG: mucoidy inhibitor MuiA family protein [Prolixibacteraceae bacterium]|nr:mucoidy inhibitor MuiA family protein [Prolixibacteraceae bacterium]
MKTIILLSLCLFFFGSFAQELPVKEIKTEVNEVTVFPEGAQIISQKTIELTAGVSVLKFTNLSPFIDAKSIQVKANGELTILSINHQANFLNKTEKSKEISELESRIAALDEKVNLENTHLSILKEQIAFLQANREVGGRSQELSVARLKEAADFYGTQLTSLKMKEIERNNSLRQLNKEREGIMNQLNTLSSKKEFPNGEILVKVDVKKNALVPVELSYVVGNAGWFPSYDIRAKNINEPVELIYKANVRQDTKMDWTNVKLRFSSTDPRASGIAPELNTYYLNYNTLPPVYNRLVSSVTGRVIDQNQQALPGVSIMVQGTSIGTVSDANGNFSITLPNQSSFLTFSFIGMKEKTLPVTGKNMLVVMEEDQVNLDEAVVIGYGVQKKLALTGAVSAVQGKVSGVATKDREDIRIRGTNSTPIPLTAVEKPTSVNFEIKTPYTIKSDNKSYTVDMEAYQLPAGFQYYSVPKIDKTAFLIANITDWEKYNLLEGEANIFFEEAYVGKTLLDTRSATDTLQISLGQDKNVIVSREKAKEFTTKQFIGNKKEESKSWKLSVRNNKSQSINMILLDQVPVSTLEEIEVSVQNISGGKQDPETGEIKWEFTLDSKVKKDFGLDYSVKYPKNKRLIVE